MDMTTEKRDSEIADSSLPNDPSNQEADERQARDLKAGLHPLKVRIIKLSIYISFRISIYYCPCSMYNSFGFQ